MTAGGRPGNSSGVRKKNGAVTPRDTVRIQPAHAAPGRTAAGVRDAYALAATLSAVTVAPARKYQPRRLPARTAMSAPTSANETVTGMKPKAAVQASPPVRASATAAVCSTTVRPSSVQASTFGSRCDMSPSRAARSRAMSGYGGGDTATLRSARPEGHDEVMSQPSFGAAARILAERDPVIARLVAEAGPPRLGRPTETHFGTLVRAIVYQQLAGRAAAAIHGRLIAALGDEVQPERLLALSDEQMRAVGLSRAKVASLRDLAAKVLDGTVVLSPRGLAQESDDDIIERLSAVRGIGPWTSEMFLLFQLRRLDVWPVGDLGVRRGYGLAWQVPTPTARELKPLGEPFRPYRSVAAWYCWRAAELYADVADSALTRLGRSFGGHDDGMQKFSLEATARELLERARGGSGGRAATTIIGGHEKVLRQTVIAMVNGATLAEHENSGEASVHVLAGRVRLTAGQHSWEGRRGDLLMVPAASHSLAALEDSAVLLTVAQLV